MLTWNLANEIKLAWNSATKIIGLHEIQLTKYKYKWNSANKISDMKFS